MSATASSSQSLTPSVKASARSSPAPTPKSTKPKKASRLRNLVSTTTLPAELQDDPVPSLATSGSGERPLIQRLQSDLDAANPSTRGSARPRGGVEAAVTAALVDRLSTPSRKSPPNDAASKTQFEQQEDFISFDASPPPPPPQNRSRFSGSAKGPQGKRKLDEYEERQHQGSVRVQKREQGRTTPWLDAPGVDWTKCDDAISM